MWLSLTTNVRPLIRVQNTTYPGKYLHAAQDPGCLCQGPGIALPLSVVTCQACVG